MMTPLFLRDQVLVKYYLLPQDTHVGRQKEHNARELFLGSQVGGSTAGGCLEGPTQTGDLPAVAVGLPACSCAPFATQHLNTTFTRQHAPLIRQWLQHLTRLVP